MSNKISPWELDDRAIYHNGDKGDHLLNETGYFINLYDIWLPEKAIEGYLSAIQKELKKAFRHKTEGKWLKQSWATLEEHDWDFRWFNHNGYNYSAVLFTGTAEAYIENEDYDDEDENSEEGDWVDLGELAERFLAKLIELNNFFSDGIAEDVFIEHSFYQYDVEGEPIATLDELKYLVNSGVKLGYDFDGMCEKAEERVSKDFEEEAGEWITKQQVMIKLKTVVTCEED